MKNTLITTICMSAALIASDLQTVTFQDNGEELTNPGMGFVFHFYDNNIQAYGSRLAPEDMLEDWKGVSQVYLRLPWSLIEPQEGHFEWSVLDTPMQRYRARGFKTSFRITCSETPFSYATPKWVEEAGAKGYRFTPGRGEQPNGSHWEPDFNDPIFLEKLDHLLAKLAERYDGHPDVELFDIGSIGTWGEGHTWASTRRAYPDDVILKHMELYHKHFKKTPILSQDDFLSRPGFITPQWKANGWTEFTFDIVFPHQWRGQKFMITAGLVAHNPHRRSDGWKTAPAPQQRVPLAILTISKDGNASVVPLAADLPANDAFPEGTEFAARFVNFDYDAENRPNSAKITASYWRPQEFKREFNAFVDIMDESGKKFIIGANLEKEDDLLMAKMAEYKYGFRDDSILVDYPPRAYFHAKAAQQLWRNAPIYIESEHYGGSAARGCWDDGYGFLQSIEDYHATYASIHWWPHEFLQANRELVRDINRIIGFRFLPQSVSFPVNLGYNEPFVFKSTWQNRGVAPAYADYYPAITLKNKNGGIAAVFVNDKFNLRNLPVALKQKAPAVSTEITCAFPPNVVIDDFDVFLSVGDQFGKPILELPIDGNDGSRRYKIGSTSLQADYSAVLSAHKGSIAERKLNFEITWKTNFPQEDRIKSFFHLDSPEGQLLKAMGGEDSGDFHTPGTYKSTFEFTLPDNLAPDKKYQVWVGLWRPERVTHENERLIPKRGRMRRVRIGNIIIKKDGTWEFEIL